MGVNADYAPFSFEVVYLLILVDVHILVVWMCASAKKRENLDVLTMYNVVPLLLCLPLNRSSWMMKSPKMS